jgi:hypothetical protein
MKHQAGDKGLMKIVNAAYDHGSRAVLLPAVVFLFITGSEYLLATRFAPGYAVLAMFLVYLPIRFMFAFKEPFRFFHFIVMAAAFFVYAQRMIGMLEDSPGSPVWRSFAGYLGDSVLVAREEGERAVLFVRNRDTGGRFVTVRRGADRKWEISRNN